jgi:hypothetical protein
MPDHFPNPDDRSLAHRHPNFCQYPSRQIATQMPWAVYGALCWWSMTKEEAVENISGVVTLLDGEETQQESAIMPLNLLPAGASLPLIAYFQPPIPESYTISARVDFFLPVMPSDQRYLAC